MLSSPSLSAGGFEGRVGAEERSLRRKITVVISRSTVISVLRTILRVSAGSGSPGLPAFRLSPAGSSIGLRTFWYHHGTQTLQPSLKCRLTTCESLLRC